jgi:predicted nucleic acid-binding protein
VIVADTNLIAYLLVNGPMTAAAEAVFLRDRRSTAPRIWHHEFLNVLSTTVRQGVLSADAALAAYERARRIVRVTSPEPTPSDVLERSVANRLATYDCEFVAFARLRRARLVTDDQQLQAVFPDVAIGVDAFASGA